MKRFLVDSGLGSLRVSCNTTRHDTARLQYERYLAASYQNYVDPECAVLEGHKPRTQLLTYNDSYVMACAYAYNKLALYAEEEQRKYADRVERVRAMIRIVDLGLNEENEEDSTSSDGNDDEDGSSYLIFHYIDSTAESAGGDRPSSDEGESSSHDQDEENDDNNMDYGDQGTFL
ncbi:unnamed protein product [Cylicostephanus goldi]|uniref:Uncharacterized protein n=1 Tax=Cylicostephanus goldi TaxID=71465 RepID=A0A3P7M5V9_CYLGO|nr:unnamed protein product [Cylicostephanus goldi]